MGEFLGIILSAIALAVFFAIVIWLARLENPREAEAIQRGYALHCPQTGDFAWKGECND